MLHSNMHDKIRCKYVALKLSQNRIGLKTNGTCNLDNNDYNHKTSIEARANALYSICRRPGYRILLAFTLEDQAIPKINAITSNTMPVIRVTSSI